MQTLIFSLLTKSFTVCLLIFFLILCNDDVISTEIAGSQESCDVENESITITDIPNMKCFNCNCKNGFVECKKQKCPSIDGCYMLQKEQTNECCKNCKGCTRNNMYYKSGTEWIEPKKPCRLLKCIAGIITESLIHCYVPCNNPSPPTSGQCCSTCPDCYLNNKIIFKETYVMSEEDPCVTCSCNLGKLTCRKRTCPILNCPESKILKSFKECCPQCLGTGNFIDPPKGACLLGTMVYQSRQQFTLDNCTYCNCENSTVHCEKKSCPIFYCKRKYQKILLHRCCAECENTLKDIIVNKMENDISFINFDKNKDNNKWYIENYAEKHNSENKSSCTYAEKIYKNGEIWNTTTCKLCICIQTKINCTEIMCPALSCKPNSILKIPEGRCCPECIENHGVCTVFGGVHFRTFDGKMFAFIGSCKYELITDCDSGSFNIRLKSVIIGNDASMKKLSLKLGKIKIDLQQNRNTKVNNKIVDLPYQLKNNLNINEINKRIMIITKIGIKINWDYMGFLEVTVPKSYRKKLCGLCGNFNSIVSDDLTTREGILVEDPVIFAQSWTSGDEVCFQTRKYGIGGCNVQKDQRLCNYIRGSVFEKCLKKINEISYYEMCLKDMCHCTLGDFQCHCESFTNYVRDCRRLGILLPRWRKSVGC